jgi:pimeloyl-ACP methyl ester carboxylesterase
LRDKAKILPIVDGEYGVIARGGLINGFTSPQKSKKENNMTGTKPSIVFCDGMWADGSCFSKVMPALQAEGHQCIAAQYSLNTTADDVATVKRTLGRVSSPAILVGHSYGGSVITGAGTDDRVAGLVYLAAFAPDADEMSDTQPLRFARMPGRVQSELKEGRIEKVLQLAQIISHANSLCCHSRLLCVTNRQIGCLNLSTEHLAVVSKFPSYFHTDCSSVLWT